MSLKVSPQARAFLATSQSDPVEGPLWKAGIDSFFQGLKPGTPVEEKAIAALFDKVYSKQVQKNPLVKELHQWFLSKLNPDPSRLKKLLTKVRENRFTEKKGASVVKTEQRAPNLAPQGLARPRVERGDLDKMPSVAVTLASDRPSTEKWKAVVAGFAGLGQQVQAQGAGQVQLQGRTVTLEEDSRRARAEAEAHLGRSADLERQIQGLTVQLQEVLAGVQRLQAADQAIVVRLDNGEADQIQRAAATLRDLQLGYDTAVNNKNQASREFQRLWAERAGLTTRQDPLLGTGIATTVPGALGTLIGTIGTPIAFSVGTNAGYSAAGILAGSAGAAAPTLFGFTLAGLPFIAIGAFLLALQVQEQKKIEELDKQIREVSRELESAQSLVARWDAARNNPRGVVQQPAAQPAVVQPVPVAQPAAAQPAVVQQPAAPEPAVQPAPVAQPEAAQPAAAPAAQPAAAPQPAQAPAEQAPAAAPAEQPVAAPQLAQAPATAPAAKAPVIVTDVI